MYLTNRDKRFKNMFWTIGEDYGEGTTYDENSLRELGLAEGEIDDFLLYEAGHRGVIFKYSQVAALEKYIESRLVRGFDAKILIPLVQIAEDVRTESLIDKIRPGYRDLKKRGMEVTVAKLFTGSDNKDTQILQGIILKLNQFPCDSKEAEKIAETYGTIPNMRGMKEFFSAVDRVYRSYWGGHLSEETADFLTAYENDCQNSEDSDEDVEWQIDQNASSIEDLTELIEDEIESDGETIILNDSLEAAEADKMLMVNVEAADEIVESIQEGDLKKVLDSPISDILMSKDIREKLKKAKNKGTYDSEESESQISQRERMYYFYGDSYLEKNEVAAMEKEYCRGCHQGFKLHLTDGAIRSNIGNEYQSIMANRQRETNRDAYEINAAANRLSIIRLTRKIEEALNLAANPEAYTGKAGVLMPNKVWKATRTNNNKIFLKKDNSKTGDLAVDLLLDASGSQGNRQRTVSAQAYMIACALTNCKIPCKVGSYCNFSDYTILRRFRDYDDRYSANENIFEYAASGNNRDGLAIQAASYSLLKRSEEHKLLIVLSDGQPADVGSSHKYDREYGTFDTATKVRSLRQKGLGILGVYTGIRENLELERNMFGNDFAYISQVEYFSDIIGKYIKKYILEMMQ